jgi:hypothetical protein
MVNGQTRCVVEVVKDVPLQTRTENLKPFVYVPFWQNPGKTEARLCARVRGDPSAMLLLVEREVHRVDPDVPIGETITLPIRMAGIFRPRGGTHHCMLGPDCLLGACAACGLC